jgi:hypothetical protein
MSAALITALVFTVVLLVVTAYFLMGSPDGLVAVMRPLANHGFRPNTAQTTMART